MNFDYEIYRLSPEFLIDYPKEKYPELLIKPARPYNCLLVDLHTDYFLCIPFRSNINHNNAYMFKNTARSIKSKSGLDYSKMVIIKESRYLHASNVIVDNDEYVETVKHIKEIVSDTVFYLDTYIGHINGTSPLHPKEYDRRYRFSTLPYFNDIIIKQPISV